MFNSLYTFTKESEGIFKVHFEGNPVLTGACMIEMTRELIEAMTGKSLSIVNVKNLKFASMVTPDNNPDIMFNITVAEKDDNITESKVQITDIDSNQLFAKISLTLKDVARA